MNEAPAHKQQRILVVDDNQAIHLDFHKILGGKSDNPALADLRTALLGPKPGDRAKNAVQYDIDSAYQGQEALAKVRKALQEGNPYVLAFVDMRMPPGWDGLETIEHIWQEDPDIQVVICTAYSDYSWEDMLERFGQRDGLLILKKPFDNAEISQLACALTKKWQLARNARARRKDLESMVEERTAELVEVNARLEVEISERRRVDEELRHSALHDALTGLPNRSMLLDRLGQSIKRTRRRGNQQIGLLFIDLDNFKLVNDSLGHDAGDELLIEAARRIGASLRDTDCVVRTDGDLTARLGGDEFVVLLDGIAASEDAVRVCERLQEELSKPLNIRGHAIKMGASIGIALGQAGQQSAELIRDADTAMYRAKSAGKGGYAVFDATMHAHVRERLQFENELRRAIEGNQLSVYYQPIVDLTTARVVAFEALVRWQHPDKGLVPPAEFLPIAEETGLIVPLGDWVLEESLGQLEQWNRDRAADALLSMNINVSRRQLLDPGFVPRLQALLDERTVPRDRVRLEITESAIVSAPERTRRVLDRLVELGVELHLDDFGTGLSSLSCLKDFPLVALKIDRSFIQGSELGRTYASILHAIVNLSHNLGLRVVAEGVENQDQLAAVLALDCDYVQGFLFSHPVPADDAEALIDVEFTCGRELIGAGRARRTAVRLGRTTGQPA